MNCEILHTLYVRSNGEIPCNDDAGERVTLGHLPPAEQPWRPADLFANERYAHIRDSLRRGVPPWPTLCPNCAFFRPNAFYADPLAQRKIWKLQVEPSLACRLRCPGCSNAAQSRSRLGPLLMDLVQFERLLHGLREESYQITDLEYCGQGEPLLHPAFPEFVRRARSYFPSTVQRVITSGNFDFAAATDGERLDAVYVSCDGVDAQSYARYRLRGQVERPLQFMRDAVRSGRDAPPPLVVWKYILFEWNDSPEELRRAQDLAQEIGVTYLLFVYTHSAGKSRRYTLANPRDLPIHHANVVTNATPIHYQQSEQPQPLGAAS